MKLKAYTAAPILAALVYLLTLCAEPLIARLDMGVNAYLATSGGIQLATYLLPLVLYFLLFGKTSVKRMRVSLPSAVSIPLAALLGCILLIGTALLSMSLERIGVLAPTADRITGVGAPNALLLVIFAILPALCEEVVFRGVILSSFEPCGTAPAIFGSALLFAFAHMSFEKLPIYFFAGVVLALATYACRSLVAAVLLHATYNIATLLLGEYLSGIAAHLESFALLFIVLLFVLGILVLLALGEGARVYGVYAERNLDSGYTPAKMSPMMRMRGRASVYFSVPFLLCTLIYIAVIVFSLQNIR